MALASLSGLFFLLNKMMEKESLISKLRERLGTTKISDKTLDVYVTNILPAITSDEMVNDAFLDSHKNILSAIAGQISHEAAEEINRYKSEYPRTTGNPKPEQSEDLKAVLKRLDDLEKEQKDKTDRERQRALMENVKAGMKAKGADDDYVLRNALRGVELDETKSVDELVESYLSNYDREYREARGSGAEPRSGGHGGSGSDKTLDNFFDRMRQEGKFPSKE